MKERETREWWKDDETKNKRWRRKIIIQFDEIYHRKSRNAPDGDEEEEGGKKADKLAIPSVMCVTLAPK